MSKWDDLIAAARTATIPAPALRAVTLAQWALESARGTSGLATQHNNFAGLKWRAEMTGFATSVPYQAHDGLDNYCAFASPAAFIAGYWRFMSRPVYNGWTTHAANPLGYINFINSRGYSGDAQYPAKVMSLLPEAEQLLGAAAAARPDLPRIVIDPGHGGAQVVGSSSPNNATGPTGLLEKTLTLDVGLRIRAMGGPRIILTRSTDVNLGLADRAAFTRTHDARVFVSIHFNAWRLPATQGTETYLHNQGSSLSFDLATSVQNHVLGATGLTDRGVKRDGFGVINPQNHRTGAAACLVEVSFLTNPQEEQRLRNTAYLDAIARAVLEGADAYVATHP